MEILYNKKYLDPIWQAVPYKPVVVPRGTIFVQSRLVTAWVVKDKVQKHQNRVIMKSPFDTSSTILRNKLKWDTCKRRQKQKALKTF